MQPQMRVTCPGDPLLEDPDADDLESERVTEDRVADDPESERVTEDRVADDPESERATEDRVADDPESERATEDRVADDPESERVTEDRVADDPESERVTEDRVADDPEAERATEDPEADDPEVERTTEDRVADDPAADKKGEHFVESATSDRLCLRNGRRTVNKNNENIWKEHTSKAQIVNVYSTESSRNGGKSMTNLEWVDMVRKCFEDVSGSGPTQVSTKKLRHFANKRGSSLD